MMTVKNHLGMSIIPGAGLGVFVSEPVKKGDIVWKFVPGLDLLLDGLPEEPLFRDYVLTYGYEPLGEPGKWLLCVDNGRFVNHSDHPNTGDTKEETFALYDLPAGTEILSNYHAFAIHPFLGFPEKLLESK
jgi:uncharacterized protein